jgi:hypothetical protein
MALASASASGPKALEGKIDCAPVVNGCGVGREPRAHPRSAVIGAAQEKPRHMASLKRLTECAPLT